MKAILYKTNIEQNHVIESIDDYLSTCDKTEISLNIVNRGIKDRDLKVTMKLPLIADVGMNYMKVYDESTSLYYFINNIEWLNDGTSILELEFDTLNTYQDYLLDTKNYKNITAKRMMKDRFQNVERTFNKVTGKYDIYAERVFDKVDEGFDDLNYYASSSSIKTTPSYVMYQVPTTTDSGTVTNYTSKIRRIFVPKEDTNVEMTRYLEQVTVASHGSTLTTGRRLFVNHHGMTFKVVSSDNTIKLFYCDAVLVRHLYMSQSVPLRTQVYFFSYDRGTFTLVDNKYYDIATVYQVYSNGPGMYYNDAASTASFPSMTKGYTYLVTDLVNTSTLTTFTKSSIIKTIKGIESINRSDSQLKQITEIPFTPSSSGLVYMGENNYVDQCEFIYNSEVATTSLNQSIGIISRVTLSNKYQGSIRDSEMESKLYGSYVRNITFQYDNNIWVLQPEYYKTSKKGIVPISLYASLNMDDNLAFRFDNFDLKSSYSNWLLCSRNNQLTIYNNEYLEYMRSGYNYDKKNKAIQSVKNWTNFGLDMISGAGKITTNAMKGDVGGIISTSANMATSLGNSIISEVNNNLALEKKKNSILNGNVTVAGSDSISIFHQYSGNELKLVLIKPNDEVLNALYNLFYFYGYSDNRFYPEGFSLKSRQFFDYYRLEIGYLRPSSTISQLALKDIQNKFKDGITFEWKYQDTWLCNQIRSNTLYENWETSLDLNDKE